MADPAPAVKLPEVEYIEIYNTSDQPVSLKNWKLAVGSRSVKLPDSTLLPHSYSILCHINNKSVLQPYGHTIALNTFSLANEGMSLSLFNAKNQLVYGVTYQINWWESGKRDGGYALEMVDVDFPCGEREIWKTSVDGTGGTPGKPNSIRTQITDILPPNLERVAVPTDKQLILYFDKKTDSLNAVSSAGIELSGRVVLKKEARLPDFKTVVLTLNEPLLAGQEYRLTIRNLAGCNGNILRETQQTIALPIEADSGDVVINEILFNPFQGGVEFFELYNTSARYISLKNWSLGTRRSDNSISYLPVTDQPFILPAHGYLVLTPDVAVVKEQYPSEKFRYMLELPSFPAYANAAGEVFVRNQNNILFDQFAYSEKMHHVLLADYKGVSLEKSDPVKPSGDGSNWHSASSTSGYATPGYVNSQFMDENSGNMFSAMPDIFTPNGDGADDFTRFTYQQNTAGRITTVRIFNSTGRLVRLLANNLLMGTHGYIEWDGTDDRGAVVETGYYLIIAEMFGTDGTTQRFKSKVVVATREH
jgi:hypothetical protein